MESELVKCGVCGYETSRMGLMPHVMQIHKIDLNTYVEKYGEYRRRQLDLLKRAETSGIFCKVCNQNVASERHLCFHLKEKHSLTKKEYVVKHILNNNIPECKCGCGKKVKIRAIGKPPYWPDYLYGHNTNDCHIGSKRSYESKIKMRESAIKRLKEKNSVFYRATSKDEVEIREWLETFYDKQVLYNDTTILRGRELDFFFPDINFAIEFNGIRFHSDLYRKKDFHVKKTEECNSLGIKLMHIWAPDWYINKDIIKSQIKNILGFCERKIYARDCEIKEIADKECKLFLHYNHLQGPVVSKIRYGLYYEKELVQVMTFGKKRKLLRNVVEEDSYELLRLCCKNNTIVVGGASKLFSHFIKSYDPKSVMSYANRDWSMGNVYEKLNMKKLGYTRPGYFYSNGKNRVSRYSCQKHILVKMGFDENSNEYEIMTSRGYYKVWDCGNIKYEWNRQQ